MKKNGIYYMVIVAIFSALACVGTLINIPMPSGGMVHLGNFVMILAALLCGGLVGGLSGSIGMGLYDVIAGYNPSTYLRTFVLKFFIGFIVGYLFRLLIKKRKDPAILSYIIGGLFVVVGIIGIVMATKCTNNVFNIIVFGKIKTVKQAEIILMVVFAFIFGIGLILAGIFSKKLKGNSRYALFAITVGMLINMVLELILRTLLTTWLDKYDMAVAFATALAKIPSSVITAFITVVLATFLYRPTYKAVKDINHLNDIEEIDEDEE